MSLRSNDFAHARARLILLYLRQPVDAWSASGLALQLSMNPIVKVK